VKSARMAIVAVSFLGFVPALRAQGAPTHLVDNPVYQDNCARCHGKEGKGHRIGPPSLVSGRVPTLAPDEIRGVIAAGKGHMPKFGDKLSSADIDQLIEQIKAPAAGK
jgi:mono/diheme cytochrome c family protein